MTETTPEDMMQAARKTATAIAAGVIGNGDEPEEQREYWRAKTRAALSELLTPSTAMLIAGVKAMRNPDLDVTEKELALGWRAMISKAMEG